ncbi:ParB-like protein [Lactobacillus gasseri 224-1]|uniref:ParB-like protein n=1 Tax=Lactobacillus gasseri 224-1 TaxID=679196 RepID=D1YHN0_LACGS|nr:ParB-like protein [Lactobacillus gasseri 224-1]
MKVETVSIDKIKPYENNPRNNDDAVDAVANSIKEFGWQQPIVVDNGGVIIAGHTRYKAAKKLGYKEVPIVVADNLTKEQVNAYRLADNKVGELADWDEDLLDQELDDILDIDMSEFGFDLNEEIEKEERTPDALTNDFMVPPFSVLDTRQGNWQDRKREWLDLGIKSELGRKGDLTFAKSINIEGSSGTSVFDPVLTEIIYKWFIPYANANIYDPFAGGSVRGIVAATLGHHYTGIDLRKEQIDANYQNAKEIGTNIDLINWYVDDSQNADKYVKDNTQDLIIACPPYLDLEVYSDDPKDLSTMSDDEFDNIYQKILQNAVKNLK